MEENTTTTNETEQPKAPETASESAGNAQGDGDNGGAQEESKE